MNREEVTGREGRREEEMRRKINEEEEGESNWKEGEEDR